MKPAASTSAKPPPAYSSRTASNQDAERTEWGSTYADHDLVSAQASGDPIRPERLTKRFEKLVKSSGLRKTRLHDLRHARASLLLASGTDIALVSKMLGHSSIATTADTYSHLLEGVGRKAAEAADALVPRRSRDQRVTNLALETVEALPGVDQEGPLTCGDPGTAECLRLMGDGSSSADP